MTENKEQKIEAEIYTIHSQKGGVGKTSVALAKAGWAALRGYRKTLIIDGDVTGTSLIDLFGAQDKFYYLNELLLADPRIFKQYKEHPQDVESNFCIPIADCKKLYFMPSSPILDDIKVIVSLISQEDKLHYFESRMKDILEIVLENGFETIIIDTPPGLYGISKAMLEMEFKETDKRKYKKRSIFLTSSDKVDYRSLFPSLSRIYINMSEKQNSCNILFNKFPTSSPRDPVFKLNEILKDLKSLLKERKENENILEKIKPTIPFVGDFSMEQIISTIKKLSGQPKDSESYGSLEKWCLGIEDIS